MPATTLSSLQHRLESGAVCLRTDSRAVRPGDVFVALPGTRVDGASFIPAAVQAGAGAVVCLPGTPLVGGVDWLEYPDPQQALGMLAQAACGTGTLPFPVIGVTGTNGKTTVTYLLEHLFAAQGWRTGVIGTVSYRWPGHSEAAPLTTPDTLSLHAMLGAMRKVGVQAAFMEVSSHALDQRRAAGVPFSGGVFTNLTQDHLDYHGTMEHYFAAKARLFRALPQDGMMAVNADDAWGQQLLKEFPQAIGFGLHQPASVGRSLSGRIVSSSPHGLTMACDFGGRHWTITSPLVGAYNVLNLLAAQAVGLGLGLDPEAMGVFENFCGVPGRLERVRLEPVGLDAVMPEAAAGQRHVFVDFAHTPDALVNVLQTLRSVGFGRIITVFGCGGDRDRTKRPLMGAAVAQWSDVAVLTSDNPRHEDPQAIIADVLPGLASAHQVLVEPDRRAALAAALQLLQPGDALLVAGKGHEQTQQIGDVKHPFSDQQILRELAACA